MKIYLLPICILLMLLSCNTEKQQQEKLDQQILFKFDSITDQINQQMISFLIERLRPNILINDQREKTLKENPKLYALIDATKDSFKIDYEKLSMELEEKKELLKCLAEWEQPGQICSTILNPFVEFQTNYSYDLFAKLNNEMIHQILDQNWIIVDNEKDCEALKKGKFYYLKGAVKSDTVWVEREGNIQKEFDQNSEIQRLELEWNDQNCNYEFNTKDGKYEIRILTVGEESYLYHSLLKKNNGKFEEDLRRFYFD